MIEVRNAWRDKAHLWNRAPLFSVEEQFQQFGYEKLGQGSRAAVYCHPQKPDVAVKIGRYDIHPPQEDVPGGDAWLIYVLNAQHWGDKKVPGVYSVTMYTDFYVAVMERCYPTGFYRLRRTANALDAGHNRFAKRLNELARTYGLRPDYESTISNIMRRKNREIVVTDPLFNTGFGSS
jgi:hypothetical protein